MSVHDYSQLAHAVNAKAPQGTPGPPHGVLSAIKVLETAIDRLIDITTSLNTTLGPVLSADEGISADDFFPDQGNVSEVTRSILSAADRINRQCVYVVEIQDRVKL